MIKIKVTGLDEAVKKMTQLPKIIQTEIKNELRASADEIKRSSQRDAPADQGGIRKSISVITKSELEYSVVVQNNYAAYMEFGTKSKAQVPAELTEYAKSFQGKGPSTGISPIDALTAWVKRKGIAGTYSVKTRRRLGSAAVKADQDKSVAFLIWRKIKKYGVSPHPFFFKNVFDERDKLGKRIEKIFSNLD